MGFLALLCCFINSYLLATFFAHHTAVDNFLYKTPCFCAILSFKFTHVWHRT